LSFGQKITTHTSKAQIKAEPKEWLGFTDLLKIEINRISNSYRTYYFLLIIIITPIPSSSN